MGMEQINRARRELAAGRDPANEVHEARKCLKRLRALLRLGRDGLGEATYRAEAARFQSTAKRLASARDSHVLLQTLAKLEAEGTEGGELRLQISRLKAALLAERAEAPIAQAVEIAEATSELDRALRRFRRLRINPDAFATFATGLVRGYRQGAKGLEVAYAENTDEAFHEWRKSVQVHWRHMALLSRMWPAMIEARVAATRELSQILGDDHDLSLLKENLPRLADGMLSRHETAQVEGLIRDRQSALRAAARPRGQMIFAERAKAHGRRMAAIWDAAVAKSREDAREKSRGDGEPHGGDVVPLPFPPSLHVV